MLELARQSDWEDINRLSVQIHDLHAAWRPDIYYHSVFNIFKKYFPGIRLIRMIVKIRNAGRPMLLRSNWMQLNANLLVLNPTSLRFRLSLMRFGSQRHSTRMNWRKSVLR